MKDQNLFVTEKPKPVFSVSELIEYINITFSSIRLTVEGEITEIHVSQSIYLFVTLSDLKAKANIKVFGLTSEITNWGALKEGMKVKVDGKPQIFKKSGQFNFRAFSILPSGEGALKAAFEILKNKLQKEGLFARKRTIPEYPVFIGLITAENSQAYKDFIKVLSRRMGGLTIYLYPVQVQGKMAISTILKALNFFEANPKLVDVLALVRGGGSLEELSAFNSEEVARAIYRAQISTVVGVGHEGNITLADLVADLRASTPSNAAELLVRNREDIKAHINFLEGEIERIVGHQLQSKRHQAFNLLISIEHNLSDLKNKTRHLIQESFYNLERLETHLQERKLIIKGIIQNLLDNQKSWFSSLKEKVVFLKKELENLSPLNILKRGYSITMTKTGKLVKNPLEVKVGELITSLLAEGKISSIVKERSKT